MAAAAILAGVVVLLAIPFAWLSVFLQLDQPALGYGLVLIGCPLSMVGWAVALHALNRRFLGFSLQRHRSNDALEALLPIAALVCLVLLIARP